MLQHYSPYKVAENFHVLASLEPGRVDLGIGKALAAYHFQQRLYNTAHSIRGKILKRD